MTHPPLWRCPVCPVILVGPQIANTETHLNEHERKKPMEYAKIDTVAELDALPVGAVVRHVAEERTEYADGSWEQGAVAEKRIDISGREAWFLVGRQLGYYSHQADLLPAQVIYAGDANV